MQFNNFSSIALHIKTHSIPKFKFRKTLFEDTTIIAYEIKFSYDYKFLESCLWEQQKTKQNKKTNYNQEN